jgi:hypothetical protein
MHLNEDDISELRKGATAFISTFKKSKLILVEVILVRYFF